MEKLWLVLSYFFMLIACPVFLIYIATHIPFEAILIVWTGFVTAAISLAWLLRSKFQHPKHQ